MLGSLCDKTAVEQRAGDEVGRKGVGEGEESQGDKQGVETLGGKGKAGGGEPSQTGAGRGRARPELCPEREDRTGLY